GIVRQSSASAVAVDMMAVRPDGLSAPTAVNENPRLRRYCTATPMASIETRMSASWAHSYAGLWLAAATSDPNTPRLGLLQKVHRIVSVTNIASTFRPWMTARIADHFCSPSDRRRPRFASQTEFTTTRSPRIVQNNTSVAVKRNVPRSQNHW